MNSCIVKLTDSISASHQVPKNEIKNFFGRRSFGVDVAMNLPFLVLYWLIAFMLAGKVLERYMPDENRLLALAVFAMASVACAAVGVLIGQVWSIVAENIRVGTGHLSYRIGRLPGVKHPILFWVICTVLFWSAGLAHQLKLGQRAFPR